MEYDYANSESGATASDATASDATTSYATTGYDTTGYALASYAPASSSAAAGEPEIGAWSDWTWNMQYGCNYRYRKNTGVTGGLENEYDMSTAASDKGKEKVQDLSLPEEATTSAITSQSSSEQSEYYYVKNKVYYHYRRGASIKLPQCPKDVWVWNENGWRGAEGCNWRMWNGKDGAARIVHYKRG